MRECTLSKHRKLRAMTLGEPCRCTSAVPAWTDLPNPLADWHDWTEAMEVAGYDPRSSAHFGNEFHPLSCDVVQRRTDEHEFADH
jgi:hypothetical protein